MKTPHGLSVEKSFDKLVLQGDTWGPTMTANQVETLGKQLLIKEPDSLLKKSYVDRELVIDH